MSNKHDKDNRRKKKVREREKAKKQRTAIVHDGESRTVIRQGNTKGYDIEMIRDFLDHLLLELRVQDFENQKLLKNLQATDDLKSAMGVTKEISNSLVQKLAPFKEKYQTVLLRADTLDGKNATESEVKGVMAAILKGMHDKRDEQIGHLEALQDLFVEALHCARLPFGVDKKGNAIYAQVVHNVRNLADDAFVAGLPKYEDLLPLFRDHVFANEEGAKSLAEHDPSVIIVATNAAYEKPLCLFGIDIVEQHLRADKSTAMVRSIPVGSFSELQFVIAAIAKFVGIPSTDGDPWKGL